ncbi:hypothetical protein TWF706_006519 [Orbilia oligospora]|nr:hypothetical protein TWF706_006519 [Orbilia oligospora]
MSLNRKSKKIKNASTSSRMLSPALVDYPPRGPYHPAYISSTSSDRESHGSSIFIGGYEFEKARKRSSKKKSRIDYHSVSSSSSSSCSSSSYSSTGSDSEDDSKPEKPRRRECSNERKGLICCKVKRRMLTEIRKRERLESSFSNSKFLGTPEVRRGRAAVQDPRSTQFPPNQGQSEEPYHDQLRRLPHFQQPMQLEPSGYLPHPPRTPWGQSSIQQRQNYEHRQQRSQYQQYQQRPHGSHDPQVSQVPRDLQGHQKGQHQQRQRALGWEGPQEHAQQRGHKGSENNGSQDHQYQQEDQDQEWPLEDQLHYQCGWEDPLKHQGEDHQQAPCQQGNFKQQSQQNPKEEYSQEQQVRKGQQRQLHQSEGGKEQEQEQGSDWAQESEQEQESGWEQESTQAREPEGFQEQELEQGNQGTQKQQTHQPHQEQQNQQFSQSSKSNDQTPTQFRSQNILRQPPLAQTFQITSDTNTRATASSSLKSRTSEDNTSSIAKLFELILSYLSPRGSSNDEEALMERIKAIDTDREETIASIQELEGAAREKDNDIATLQGEMQEMRQDINQMQKQLGQSAKQNQMLRKTLDQLRNEEHQKGPGIKGCKSLRQRPTFPVKFEVYDPDTGTTETGTIIPYGSS